MRAVNQKTRKHTFLLLDLVILILDRFLDHRFGLFILVEQFLSFIIPRLIESIRSVEVVKGHSDGNHGGEGHRDRDEEEWLQSHLKRVVSTKRSLTNRGNECLKVV